MKIGKMTVIFIVVGVFLIVGITMGYIRTQQAKQEQQLEQNLTQARQKLALIRTDDLEAQKEQITGDIQDYKARIDSALNSLPVPNDNIDATDTVLQTARSFGVNIVNISSSGESGTEIKDLTGTALPLNLTVEGSVQNIASFVVDLSRKFPTGTVKMVQIHNPEIPVSGLEEGQEIEPANAAITITIFNYKGE